ncbi:hrp65 protein-like [Plodia interpunctella]|uniref:hrp65 protein-like n=1 Tax=Plodia interpunctella TaxID=58824 RepID=UPI0023678C6D|nr:hrp65 protein-like [Plodia interpunctella]
MQAMNHYNRGFGGPPQPQRQNRRGNNRGGFRGHSRFDNSPHQRNQNQGQGVQRPNNENQQNQPAAKPQQQVQQQQNQQQQKQQPQQQQPKPQQQQQPKPQQPIQQQQQKPETPVQKPPQQQQKTTPQQQPAKSAPSAPANSESQDKVDKAIPEQKLQNQNQNQGNQNQQQQRNMNGNFGGPNKQGGWSQGAGGPGNKPSGNFNQGGPGNKPPGGNNFNQGGPGNKAGGNNFNQGGPGNKPGGNNFNQGNRPFGQKQGGGPGGPGGPPRNQPQQRNNRGPHGNMDGLKPAQREEHMLSNKLKDLMGPLLDLPPIDQSEVKFNGRSRLYIGNLTNDVTEEEILALFAPFGETAELFLNKEKNFGFIKMDFRVSAEKAKRELDGKMRNGRTLRVRFAPHNSAIRVKNLPPFVSNELLYRAFEIFGKIERAYVKVDERGKTLGEGVVEYARKPSALAAIRNCTDKCFFLTSSLRPVIVENFEEPDEFDGYPEKNLPKKHPEFLKAREIGPRFSELNSFEHEYGTRWKQLHELHRQKEEALKKELSAEEEKLEAQMEYAKYEHETELLREQLRQREQDRERQKRSWEMAERAADERRETERAQLLRQEEQLSQRMRQQDDELRRRQQENTLFVQAQRLNSMLDRQEQGMFDQQKPMDGGFRDQYDMPRGGYDDMPQGRGWDGPRQMDDFPNKRRRF